MGPYLWDPKEGLGGLGIGFRIQHTDFCQFLLLLASNLKLSGFVLLVLIQC